MRTYLILLLFLLSFCAVRSQSPGGVKDLQGQSIPLDSITSRKMLIVILPASSDTAIIGQLLRFQSRHAQQVTIMGIVSQGMVNPSVKSAGNGYDRLRAGGIWLTAGMAAGDSAASTRQSVLKYISNKSRARQVDRLAEGSKYFLSEKGRLFAQLGGNISLDSRVADYIIQTNVPGENRY